MAYCSEWKANYKKLVETIREYKWMAKEHSRSYNAAWLETKGQFPYYYRRGAEILKANPRYESLINKHKSSPYDMTKIRKDATTMLEELKQAKIEAQRQYLAAHTKEMVTA